MTTASTYQKALAGYLLIYILLFSFIVFLFYAFGITGSTFTASDSVSSAFTLIKSKHSLTIMAVVDCWCGRNVCGPIPRMRC